MPSNSMFSRRSFMQISAVASAAAAFRIVHEPMMVRADWQGYPDGAVRIDSNENPLGPSAAHGKRLAPLSRRADVTTTVTRKSWKNCLPNSLD